MAQNEFNKYSPIVRKWIELDGPPMEYRTLPIKERTVILNMVTKINILTANLLKPILNEKAIN